MTLHLSHTATIICSKLAHLFHHHTRLPLLSVRVLAYSLLSTKHGNVTHVEGGWERVMVALVRVAVVTEKAREEGVRVTVMEGAAVVAAGVAVVVRERVREEEGARVRAVAVVRVREEEVTVMEVKEMAGTVMVKEVKARGTGARGWVAGWGLGEAGMGLVREGCCLQEGKEGMLRRTFTLILGKHDTNHVQQCMNTRCRANTTVLFEGLDVRPT